MLVGFYISNFNNEEAAAVDFIRKVCILPSPKIAQNIVNGGVGVPVYPRNITEDILNAQAFECSPIIVPEDSFMVVPIVNFTLELLKEGVVQRVRPYENLVIPSKDEIYYKEYEKTGYVRIYRHLSVLFANPEQLFVGTLPPLATMGAKIIEGEEYFTIDSLGNINFKSMPDYDVRRYYTLKVKLPKGTSYTVNIYVSTIYENTVMTGLEIMYSDTYILPAVS